MIAARIEFFERVVSAATLAIEYPNGASVLVLVVMATGKHALH